MGFSTLKNRINIFLSNVNPLYTTLNTYQNRSNNPSIKKNIQKIEFFKMFRKINTNHKVNYSTHAQIFAL